ncbi:hypothetical protein ACFSGX_03635 [Sphingomonas arantia]|uniref:Uncharacterized protein n=1 Tax=Sphingomonas arantia TaxID=1460676 RepID=A0ABW4TT67_9SPHN
MANYWVVGATVSDQDMSDDFITRGFWFGDRDSAQDVIANIVVGDRLAIKSMLGQGSKEVWIKAIGVVTNCNTFNAMPFKFFYVNWIDVRAENRRSPFHNFSNTIRNLDSQHELVKEIFRI